MFKRGKGNEEVVGLWFLDDGESTNEAVRAVQEEISKIELKDGYRLVYCDEKGEEFYPPALFCSVVLPRKYKGGMHGRVGGLVGDDAVGFAQAVVAYLLNLSQDGVGSIRRAGMADVPIHFLDIDGNSIEPLAVILCVAAIEGDENFIRTYVNVSGLKHDAGVEVFLYDVLSRAVDFYNEVSSQLEMVKKASLEYGGREQSK